MKNFLNCLCFCLVVATVWFCNDLYRATPESRTIFVIGGLQVRDYRSPYHVYQVKKGDKLESIARKFAVHEDQIRKVNGLELEGSLLRINQILLVPKPKSIKKKKVIASFYAEDFQGKPMANGKPFDLRDPTICAHKTLPIETVLKVTNRQNGKSILVKVQDRGPYIKGRELDLSKEAFSRIASVKDGLIEVDFEIVTSV